MLEVIEMVDPNPSVQIEIGGFPDGDIDTEYDDSDELKSIHSEDDTSRSSKFRVFDVVNAKEHTPFQVGDQFSNAAEFRKALQRDAILVGYNVIFLKNESYRTTAVCSKRDVESCKWRIHASWGHDKKYYQVKTLVSKHTCGRIFVNRSASASWVAETYEEMIRLNPKWDVKALQQQLLSDHMIDVPLAQLYRAKNIVKTKFDGNFREQYWKIRDYGNMILVKNPGSFVRIEMDHPVPNDPPVFKRMFIAYAAQIQGFKSGCRPLIGLDGCNLTSIEGLLLNATGRDANNEIFSIAIAVVESENKEAWMFFLDCLLSALGPVEEHNWIFISDRQKGLIQAPDIVAPTAEHRFCVRHMYQNMLKAIRGAGNLRMQFHKCAKAYTPIQFEEELKLLKERSLKAYDWLKKQHDPKYWSRAFFSTHVKCDLVVNNISESWNSTIIQARDCPILTMLEMIRRQLMMRFFKKSNWIKQQEGKICPNVLKKLSREITASGPCKVYMNGLEFEVHSGGRPYIVNLDQWTCDCRKWEMTGIPCPHAIAALRTSRKNPQDYVHSCYYIGSYMQAYKHIINPIPHCSQWLKTNLPAPNPPLHRTKVGRPTKKRRRGIDESKTRKSSLRQSTGSLKCAKCKQWGHNKRSCKNEEVASSSGTGNKPGRPRKLFENKSEFGGSSASREAGSTQVGGVSLSKNLEDRASQAAQLPSNPIQSQRNVVRKLPIKRNRNKPDSCGGQGTAYGQGADDGETGLRNIAGNRNKEHADG